MEVKVQKISFSYNRSSIPVLSDVNFKVIPTKITGIVGKSGSGKSTLLDIISGTKIPTKGKVIIDGITISKKITVQELKEIKKNIGYLPQNPENLFFCDTVKNNIYAYLEYLDVEVDKIDDRIIEIFKLLNLDCSFLFRDPFSLSSSELRKVALSMILIYNPSVIILDEPSIGLDSLDKQILVNYLTRIKKIYEKTIIISSNDIEFLYKVCDEFVILNKGNVIKLENKSEIFNDVKFFNDNQLALPQIVLFEDSVFKIKEIRLGRRIDINDLIKDILRKK